MMFGMSMENSEHRYAGKPGARMPENRDRFSNNETPYSVTSGTLEWNAGLNEAQSKVAEGSQV